MRIFRNSSFWKKVNINGVTPVGMKNRKMAKEQDFKDNFSFYQQLGLMQTE
jgi:hypothetical protein